MGFYANDFAASQSQGGRTVGFSLDPMQNRVVDTTDSAAATVTNHFADAGDSPAWTSTSSGWTRNLIGLAGLVETVDQDVVATRVDDPAATGIAGYSESTEFGAPRVASAAPDTYGWLGVKRRSANDLGGLMLMGVRLYDSATGRFLSVDPVRGGTDNPYVYVTNPLDAFDLTGQKWHWRHWVASRWHYTQQHWRGMAQIGLFAGCVFLSAGACAVGGAVLGVASAFHHRAGGWSFNRGEAAWGVGSSLLGGAIGSRFQGGWRTGWISRYGRHAMGHAAGSFNGWNSGMSLVHSFAGGASSWGATSYMAHRWSHMERAY